MSKLIFKMKYSGKRWNDYLPELFGKETAEKCIVESQATAKTNEARIIIYNFNGNKEILNKIKNNENTISAYIVEDNKVQKILLKNAAAV
ncbi:MAG: hypothetical protein L3J56_06170 [Bacteroidales bacterium]|nr:hypothetical protein [Bacteroidales bacterium]